MAINSWIKFSVSCLLFVHIASANINQTIANIVNISPLKINNGDIVTILFYSDIPTADDWIGAYSPADVDPALSYPVIYSFCAYAQNYLTSGKGTLHFNFTNLRDDIKFYFFTNGTKYPVVLHKYEYVVSFFNYNEPLKARIVPENNNTMKLLWSSKNSSSPMLKWGVLPKSYTTTVQAITTHINSSELCGSPAISMGWRDLGAIHAALFELPVQNSMNTIYFIFGDNHTKDWSKEHTFKLPSRSGHHLQKTDKPRKVIVVCDMGTGVIRPNDDAMYWDFDHVAPFRIRNESASVPLALGDLVLKNDIEAVIHGGDLSYANGVLSVWDFFLNLMTPVMSRAIYLNVVGNHESDYPVPDVEYTINYSGGECSVPSMSLLPMPFPATLRTPW